MPGEQIDFELIAGFGNPGSDYDQTRHNAGFWFIDALARQYGASLSLDKKHFAETATININGRKVHLVKPMTFMNRSGQGLSSVARFYKIPTNKILVAHDELDIGPGHIKVKKAGGHGGHNGLRDAIAQLGSNEFWRLRIGIGHPGHKDAVPGFVLKRASRDDQDKIERALDVALAEADRLIGGDINEATKAMHSHKPA